MFQSVCDITTSIPTTPWAGRSGVQMSAAPRDLSLHQTSKLAQAPTQPPIHRCFCPGMSLTIHLHLLPELIMSGSIPPLPLCASKACTGAALFYLYLISIHRCPTRSLPFRPSNHNFLQVSFFHIHAALPIYSIFLDLIMLTSV